MYGDKMTAKDRMKGMRRRDKMQDIIVKKKDYFPKESGLKGKVLKEKLAKSGHKSFLAN